LPSVLGAGPRLAAVAHSGRGQWRSLRGCCRRTLISVRAAVLLHAAAAPVACPCCPPVHPAVHPTAWLCHHCPGSTASGRWLLLGLICSGCAAAGGNSRSPRVLEKLCQEDEACLRPPGCSLPCWWQGVEGTCSRQLVSPCLSLLPRLRMEPGWEATDLQAPALL